MKSTQIGPKMVKLLTESDWTPAWVLSQIKQLLTSNEWTLLKETASTQWYRGTDDKGSYKFFSVTLSNGFPQITLGSLWNGSDFTGGQTYQIATTNLPQFTNSNTYYLYATSHTFFVASATQGVGVFEIDEAEGQVGSRCLVSSLKDLMGLTTTVQGPQNGDPIPANMFYQALNHLGVQDNTANAITCDFAPFTYGIGAGSSTNLAAATPREESKGATRYGKVSDRTLLTFSKKGVNAHFYQDGKRLGSVPNVLAVPALGATKEFTLFNRHPQQTPIQEGDFIFEHLRITPSTPYQGDSDFDPNVWGGVPSTAQPWLNGKAATTPLRSIAMFGNPSVSDDKLLEFDRRNLQYRMTGFGIYLDNAPKYFPQSDFCLAVDFSIPALQGDFDLFSTEKEPADGSCWKVVYESRQLKVKVYDEGEWRVVVSLTLSQDTALSKVLDREVVVARRGSVWSIEVWNRYTTDYPESQVSVTDTFLTSIGTQQPKVLSGFNGIVRSLYFGKPDEVVTTAKIEPEGILGGTIAKNQLFTGIEDTATFKTLIQGRDYDEISGTQLSFMGSASIDPSDVSAGIAALKLDGGYVKADGTKVRANFGSLSSRMYWSPAYVGSDSTLGAIYLRFKLDELPSVSGTKPLSGLPNAGVCLASALAANYGSGWALFLTGSTPTVLDKVTYFNVSSNQTLSWNVDPIQLGQVNQLMFYYAGLGLNKVLVLNGKRYVLTVSWNAMMNAVTNTTNFALGEFLGSAEHPMYRFKGSIYEFALIRGESSLTGLPWNRITAFDDPENDKLVVPGSLDMLGSRTLFNLEVDADNNLKQQLCVGDLKVVVGPSVSVVDESMVGSKAYSFGGTATSAIKISHKSKLARNQFANGSNIEYTLDLAVKFNTVSATEQTLACVYSDADGFNRMELRLLNGQFNLTIRQNATTSLNQSHTVAPVAGEVYDLRVVRGINVLTSDATFFNALYINGVRVFVLYEGWTSFPSMTTSTLVLGNNNSGSSPFKGVMAAPRWTRACRWFQPYYRPNEGTWVKPDAEQAAVNLAAVCNSAVYRKNGIDYASDIFNEPIVEIARATKTPFRSRRKVEVIDGKPELVWLMGDQSSRVAEGLKIRGYEDSTGSRFSYYRSSSFEAYFEFNEAYKATTEFSALLSYTASGYAYGIYRDNSTGYLEFFSGGYPRTTQFRYRLDYGVPVHLRIVNHDDRTFVSYINGEVFCVFDWGSDSRNSYMGNLSWGVQCYPNPVPRNFVGRIWGLKAHTGFGVGLRGSPARVEKPATLDATIGSDLLRDIVFAKEGAGLTSVAVAAAGTLTSSADGVRVKSGDKIRIPINKVIGEEPCLVVRIKLIKQDNGTNTNVPFVTSVSKDGLTTKTITSWTIRKGDIEFTPDVSGMEFLLTPSLSGPTSIDKVRVGETALLAMKHNPGSVFISGSKRCEPNFMGDVMPNADIRTSWSNRLFDNNMELGYLEFQGIQNTEYEVQLVAITSGYRILTNDAIFNQVSQFDADQHLLLTPTAKPLELSDSAGNIWKAGAQRVKVTEQGLLFSGNPALGSFMCQSRDYAGGYGLSAYTDWTFEIQYKHVGVTESQYNLQNNKETILFGWNAGDTTGVNWKMSLVGQSDGSAKAAWGWINTNPVSYSPSGLYSTPSIQKELRATHAYAAYVKDYAMNKIRGRIFDLKLVPRKKVSTVGSVESADKLIVLCDNKLFMSSAGTAVEHYTFSWGSDLGTLALPV